MQSKENLVKKQEEAPGAEEVTISLEEYSNMKKRLHELGCMGPSMQSQTREESPGVVPETPHLYYRFPHYKLSWSDDEIKSKYVI